MSDEETVDGRQLRWEQHKSDRRKAIVDAALEVLESRQPGEAIQVQEIADQAGLNRSALHRRFADRGDLDRAIQTEICGRASAVILSAVELEGRPRDIVHRIVDAFVQWLIAHQGWMRFVELPLSDGQESPLEEALQVVSGQIESLISGFAELLGRELSDVDRATLDPWVSGFVGGGLAAVRRWMHHDGSVVQAADLVDLVTDMVWFQIDGLARSRGVEIPEVPVETLLGVE